MTTSVLPAAATTQDVVARSTVLAAATGARAAKDPQPLEEYDSTTRKALVDLANRALRAGEAVLGAYPFPVQKGDDADGLLVIVVLGSYDDDAGDRYAVVTAIAPTAAGLRLSGSSTLAITYAPTTTHATTVTKTLSGEAFVQVVELNPAQFSTYDSMTFTAHGHAVNGTTTTKVPDTKTKAEKKAAKKKYAKRVKAAKKKYTKALKKAGHDASKKSAAKKAYSAAKRSAKEKYRYAIADYTIVEKASGPATSRPFSVTTARADG